MKNFKKEFTFRYSKGFTLIELLMVVTIISILAAIVLSSLSTSRNKGSDAAVKANLNTVRGATELFFSNNGNSFLPSGVTSPFGITVCPVFNSPVNTGTSMFSRDQTIFNAIAEATKQGSRVNSCYNSSTLWAVSVGLKSDASKSWCIDSGGKSKQVNFAPATAIDTTSFSCK